MVAHTPVGVVASTFLFLYDNSSSFPGKVSKRLPSLPGLTTLRIGGVLNYMAGVNITNGAVAPSIAGEYPHNFMQGGGRNYQVITSEVQNALQRLTMTANLTAAMQCVVNIQDSFFALAVDKITGAMDETGRAMHHVYNGVSVYKGYKEKASTTVDLLKQLRDHVQAQRGDPVNVFLNAM